MSLNLADTVIKPMHPEGRRFVAAFAVATLLLFALWTPLGWIGAGLTVWCYYFFRDPERFTPARPGVVVSPADGVVSEITRAAPPPELGLGDAPLQRISVFMSVFDVHVNRMPHAGSIERIAYRPGKFLSASLDKASEDNERQSLLVALPDGRRLAVTQIAGLVARRIVTFAAEGQTLATGERFGLIRFGSRADVYLPDGAEVLALEGQRMIAGETVVARLPDAGDG
ncbi:MAG: phosphatidylserine decarboxylase [Hasllibacter sp.]